MKILVLGDVVGAPGRKAVKTVVAKNRDEYDLIIVNAENIAGGSGITPSLADELFEAGIHVITSGDHIWKKKEVYDYIAREPRLLRPGNYPRECPGRGSYIAKTRAGVKVGVINLIGRIFMNPCDCPFKAADELVRSIEKETQLIVVDMHAEATSEKIAMGWYLDGRVSAVVGTHTHIPTADERILPKGTAYITDLGMSGPYDSVIGREKDKVIQTLVTRLPERFDVATGDVRACGVSLELDDKGLAIEIKRVVYRIEGNDGYVQEN